MILKSSDAPSLRLNLYSSVDKLPLGWVNVEFNLRLKKHKEALHSTRTRVIYILEGWGGTKKYRKPILSYATDSPEIIEVIREHGDISNVERFILDLR